MAAYIGAQLDVKIRTGKRHMARRRGPWCGTMAGKCLPERSHSEAPRPRYCYLTTLARPTHCRWVPSGSPGSGYREAWQRVGED